MESTEIHTKKAALEDSINRGSADQVTIVSYLQILETLDRTHSGIVSFKWPSVTYPLYFRCGTSDLSNFKQIFIQKEYGFPVPYQPRRIMDLGAYVGYAAVYLATRFPDAYIISLEPARDNFRMLSLNVPAYNNIKILNAAVWGCLRTSRSSRPRLAIGEPGLE